MERGVRNTIIALLGLAALIVVLFATSVVSIKIDFPPTGPPKAAAPVFVGMQPDGRLTVDDKPTTLDTLTHDVATHFDPGPKDQQRIMIRAPKDVKFERLMDVLNRLRDHGWTKIGLINEDIGTEPEPQSGPDPNQH